MRFTLHEKPGKIVLKKACSRQKRERSILAGKGKWRSKEREGIEGKEASGPLVKQVKESSSKAGRKEKAAKKVRREFEGERAA